MQAQGMSEDITILCVASEAGLPLQYKGEFMYGSYISSRMLNTFSYGSQLPKRDNLHIKDKRPAPNLSVIRKFYCNPCLTSTFCGLTNSSLLMHCCVSCIGHCMKF